MSSDKVRHGMAGMTASLQGSLQSLGETVELHRQRANLAESRLMERDEVVRNQATRLFKVTDLAIEVMRLTTGDSRLYDLALKITDLGRG